MQILDNLIVITLHVLCFVAGVKLANYYNSREKISVKEALERQYMRLRTNMDADDPCKPYRRYRVTGDTDSDAPIPPEFMDRLHENGTASMMISKNDLGD